MASLKIVLRNKPNNDGSLPLAIRITKDRTSSFTFIGHSIEANQWDAVHQRVKKNHPNSARLNNLLSAKFAEANAKLLELETQKNDVSSRAIKMGIVAEKHASFFKQAAIYLAALEKKGDYNRHSADKPRIERLREFFDGGDVAFVEITPTVLKRFQGYLKETRGISERTIVNHLVVIRTIFNQAIASQIVDRKYYPFGKGKIVIKFPDSLKIGLTPKQVQEMELLNLAENPLAHHARNIFLFSFYFAGMRVSDVLRLKWSDFQSDRLHYSMGKNDKSGSLKVPQKAMSILEQYRRENTIHNLVFPDLETVEDLNNEYEVEKRINQKLKRINAGLADISTELKLDKNITMHIARHTFGNISGDKIPIQMLQKLYRHTSITTTIGYQGNFIHKDADEALDAVIGF